MTVLWIILGVLAGIIALIVILLHFSIRAYIAADNKGLDFEVKYLWFGLYKLKLPEEKPENESTESASIESESTPNPEDKPEIELIEIKESPESNEASAEEKEPSSSNEEPHDASESEPEENESKPSLIEQFNEYKKYIPAGKKAFRKLLKLIRIYHLRFSLTVGNDDPYKAGMSFGAVNSVFYSLLGLICCLFKVKIDSTEIKCDFENKRSDFELSAVIYARPSAILAIAAYVGIYYLKIKKSMKKLENKAKENTANE